MFIKVTDHLKKQVIDYFSANAGRRIKNEEISRLYGLCIRTSREMLNKMVEEGTLRFETTTGGHGRRYFIPGAYDDKQVAAPKAAPLSAKEYKPGKEWETVYERLEEFRAIKSKFV